MMFERFGKSSQWLRQMGVDVPDPAAFDEAGSRMRRDQLLIFSRWCQVMLRFERGMYTDPQQDLNRLWWDLVERYQLVRRPEDRNAPDYASKIHVVSAPAYYHNYMMGELFACQLHAAIARDVLQADDPSRAVYVRESGGRPLHDRQGLCPRPSVAVERADTASDRRTAERRGLRRGIRVVTR